jgi:hypothetical protein
MNANKKILGSLVLATVLFTGCGSTDTVAVADTQQTPALKIKVEDSKQEKLQKYLRENGDTYQSASYSNDKREILLVGIKDTTVTFYKFDSATLALQEKFSFDNIDGQIGIKEVGSDGLYTIITHKDSDASDYIFDSINGELVKEKDYVLKDSKVLIQESLADGTNVKELVYTPQKQGVAVLLQSDTGESSLYLYGLEDPSNPLKEYMITAVDSDDIIEDIKMIGDGKLEYTTSSKVHSGVKSVVTYDYFNKKEISQTTTDKENEIEVKIIASRIGDFVAYSYSKDGDGIFVIAKGNGKERYIFYRLDAQTLNIVKVFVEPDYGVRYDLGDDSISSDDITALDGGKFEIKSDFGIYVFDYIRGEGGFDFEENVAYTNDYDERVENILSKNETYIAKNFLVIDTGDNKLLVEARISEYERRSINIIDLDDNTITKLFTVTTLEKYTPLHINKEKHIITYHYRSRGFDQYTAIKKINYISGKVTEKVSISAGMGG